jgi:hypothetical protein
MTGFEEIFGPVGLRGKLEIARVSEEATMRVSFLDVGQGDCTLVRISDPDWTALVDGGRRKQIEPHLAALRHEAQHLNLVVVTHPDADHIEGVIRLVESSTSDGPTIDRLLLPPILHPTGEAVSVETLEGLFPRTWSFLADHLLEGGLGRNGLHKALISLEDLLEGVADLDQLGPGLRSAVDRLAEQLDSDRDQDSPDDRLQPISEPVGDYSPFGLGEGLVSNDVLDVERLERVAVALRDADLPHLANTTLAAKMVAEHARAAEIVKHARRAHNQDAAHVRRALAVADDSVAADVLNRLLAALERADIEPILAPAPPLAEAQGQGFEVWHIAPTAKYLAHLSDSLPKLKEQVMRLAYVPPPSNINRASHVLAIRRPGGPGVLCTGDAGFGDATGGVPDSLSTGWESVISWTRVIDVPHHGGSNWRFFPRVMAASPKHSLVLYISIAAGNESSPPHESLGCNLQHLATAAGYGMALVAHHPVRAAALSPLPQMRASGTQSPSSWMTFYLAAPNALLFWQRDGARCTVAWPKGTSSGGRLRVDRVLFALP